MNSFFNLGNTKTRKSKEKPFHYNWFSCNKRWKLVLQHVSQHKTVSRGDGSDSAQYSKLKDVMQITIAFSFKEAELQSHIAEQHVCDYQRASWWSLPLTLATVRPGNTKEKLLNTIVSIGMTRDLVVFLDSFTIPLQRSTACYVPFLSAFSVHPLHSGRSILWLCV